MTESTAVLVIGGGATGVGVARDLALRDVDVTLVEADGLGSGTSGRSHGLLHSGARYAESDPEGASECRAESAVLRDIAGDCVRNTRGLFVQLADDDPAYFEEKRAACHDVGIDTEEIDAAAAREAVPDLSEETERAMWVDDAVIYPSRLVAATAADAADAGADIHTHSPVVDATVQDGAVDRVTVGGEFDETVEPTYVVNAGGAWAGQIADVFDIDVGMAPSRGVMVSVDYDGPHPVLNRCRDPDDGDIVVPHEGETVLGTTSVPVSSPDDYEQEQWEIDRSIEECAEMLPAVGDADVVRKWWGVRPLYAPDEAGEDRRGISRGFFLLDHGRDGVDNAASVVGGKLTTYRQMAEETVDHICETLGVDADCVTADRELPAADDPDRLDEFVARYDAKGQTDRDVVTAD